MRIHIFMHVPFEGPAAIGDWFLSRGARVSFTRFFENDTPPPLETLDWLVVMGGPMSVNDEAAFPWLRTEKAFVAEAVRQGKTVLGVCLGAQLIASALGGSVGKNRVREIGWFPVTRVNEDGDHPLGRCFPSGTEVFHWHGETFSPPAGATHLLRSEGCEHQAFAVGDRVLALQFHLETTKASVRDLAAFGGDDLTPQRFVQSPEEMLADPGRFGRLHARLDCVLTALWDITLRR